jgi:uncharacterized protein (DUF1015 family)
MRAAARCADPKESMATLKPFAAYTPRPQLAARICELPYDVMSSEEARAIAAGNPLSFLHVSKPEIDLPPGTDVHAPQVYAKGAENLRRLIAQGALTRQPQPAYYLYRQVMARHTQIGIVAAASCEEYLANTIRKHEYTRPDKEDDRVRHIEALDAQTGPVFLTYRAHAAIDAFVSARVAASPSVDFTAPDGVRHSSWTVADAAGIAFIEREFGAIANLYIADGHHRSAAAGRVYRARGGAGASARFLTVAFPHDQVQILPYNRVLKDLHGRTGAALLQGLAQVYDVTPDGAPAPAHKHVQALYLAGRWYGLQVKPALRAARDPIEGLDVSILQRHVLAPLFGIDDPRTSKRINFVGGIRGTAELERLVDQGEYACAFSLYPTGIEDLMRIADAGGVMPPKSTWFEPKLRDGMYCYML